MNKEYNVWTRGTKLCKEGQYWRAIDGDVVRVEVLSIHKILYVRVCTAPGVFIQVAAKEAVGYFCYIPESEHNTAVPPFMSPVEVPFSKDIIRLPNNEYILARLKAEDNYSTCCDSVLPSLLYYLRGEADPMSDTVPTMESLGWIKGNEITEEGYYWVMSANVSAPFVALLKPNGTYTIESDWLKPIPIPATIFDKPQESEEERVDRRMRELGWIRLKEANSVGYYWVLSPAKRVRTYEGPIRIDPKDCDIHPTCWVKKMDTAASFPAYEP